MSHQSFVKSSGAIPDGYVLTYSVADGYWKPKLASAISGIQKQVEWSLVDRAINNSLSLTNLAGSFTTGIRFQVQNTLTITGVRFRYNATANKTIKVSLWDNTQARIASGTVAVTTGTSVYSGYFDVPYTVTSSTQNKTLAVSIWQNDGGSYNAGAADSNQASTPFKAGPFLWYPFAFSNYGTGDAFIASTAGGEVYNYIEPIFGEVLLTTPNASGDLSGVYPNPTVAKIKGNAVATQTLGAAQDGYQLTWSNTDGYWKAKVASSSGWITALDLDYTAATTQSLATDTTYTIGGVIHTKINSAADATAMAVTNTVGLVQIPAAASAYSATARTAPGVKIDLASLIPDFYPGMKVRVWAKVSYTNMGTTAQDLPYLIVEPGSFNLSYIRDIYNDTGTIKHQAFVAFASVNTTANSTGNTGDDIMILEAVIGEPNMTGRSGTWSAGWPVMSAINYRHYVRHAGASGVFDNSNLNAAVWNVLLAAGRNGTGNAFQVTWKNLRIDYKP